MNKEEKIDVEQLNREQLKALFYDEFHEMEKAQQQVELHKRNIAVINEQMRRLELGVLPDDILTGKKIASQKQLDEMNKPAKLPEGVKQVAKIPLKGKRKR